MAMPRIAPAILERRGGFSGTSKRPPLRVLGAEIAMGGSLPPSPRRVFSLTVVARFAPRRHSS